VAGLVGEGLSRLFTQSGYESQEVEANAKSLGNTMGWFLQKTNITRDYLEDLRDGRAFWPYEIWSKYSTKASKELSEFEEPENLSGALKCLNHMVTDAL
jgi:farnesyl-diphosphate farnesyltransferase